MIELGVRPVFVHGFADDPTWTRNFAQAMERIGVESLWACEHIVLAKHYEPRYPYSADGRMPAPPGVVMPDPVEWLSFVAAVTDRIKSRNQAVGRAAKRGMTSRPKRSRDLHAASSGRSKKLTCRLAISKDPTSSR